MKPCRLIIDSEPGTGAWNMAVDEALLEAALAREETFLRWYGWQEATISLGYFQTEEDADSNESLQNVPRVRRLTGGGAILHHHEITYSCMLPSSHSLTNNPYHLYEIVHEVVIDLLRKMDIPVALRGSTFGKEGPEAFLCFGRGDAFDVVLNQYKVLGSAQRRRKGAILQHGSLMLSRSELTPQFLGIRDLVGSNLAVDTGLLNPPLLTSRLGELVGKQLAAEVVREDFRREDRLRAEQLQEERYNNSDWTKRKAR